MPKNFVEEAKNYIFAEKFEQWEEATANVNPVVLENVVNLMKLLENGYNYKKTEKFMKEVPQEVREEVLRLITNYADRGPDYAFDKLYYENHGKIDRNSEYVKGLFYKMDQNDILRGKERDF